MFFIGGCFFKYPDVISSSITITTEHPPAWIVARGNGKIREVYHQDRDSVKEGSIIAVLDNPAKTADAMWLKLGTEKLCINGHYCKHHSLY